MPTILITGASRGLGLEFAKQYATLGWRVIACCRNPEGAEALAGLPGIEIEFLDLADRDSIRHLAEALKGTAIDVLLNNAGVYPDKEGIAIEDRWEDWDKVMRTNVMAPLMMAQCFTPHVGLSEQKKIVTLSSIMGSIDTIAIGGAYMYRSSKAAVNAAMKSFLTTVQDLGITVGLLHPGWVRTDMGGEEADIDAETAVSGMIKVIDGLGIAETGAFKDYQGKTIPW